MSEKLLCDFCGTETSHDSDFCTKCGTIFIDNVDCFIHPDDDAKGVCTICHQAYCKKCGLRVNGIFLCNQHSDYEIYEGMARVLGSSDEQKINYFKSVLEENKLHPFLYSRKSTPLNLGGPDYLAAAHLTGDRNGNSVYEIKLLVPCAEVLQAEKIIDELEQSTIE